MTWPCDCATIGDLQRFVGYDAELMTGLRVP